MKIFKRPFAYALCFTIVLTSLNVYVLLKTFVIADVQGYVAEAAIASSDKAESNRAYTNESSLVEPEGSEVSADGGQADGTAPTITANSYEDENIKINIDTITRYGTQIYIADITLSSPEYLRTALANNAFGTNVVAKTSEMAEDNGAILAVNGDYYGANSKGYVIKNGEVYRDSVRSDSENDDLVIYKDGSMALINESEVSAEELVNGGAYNLFAFGPALIENSKIAADETAEVARAMTANPRTAIGIIDELHYVIIVSDGRTHESKGLSLYELAGIFGELGATTAYNLDGGGSSAMYFNGRIVNNPTTSGRRISEREVSDIVYIGY